MVFGWENYGELLKGDGKAHSGLILLLLARQLNSDINITSRERIRPCHGREKRIRDVYLPPRPSPAFLKHRIAFSILPSEFPAMHAQIQCKARGGSQ